MLPINAARGLTRAGFVCGAAFVAAAVIRGCDDLRWAALFGACALLVLWVSGALGIRLLLKKRLAAEIARGNVAAGLAGGAHYAATGLVVARCFYGDALGELWISAAFFVIAQLTLHLFVVLFRALTLYADDEEIIGENVAAALSYAGAMLAIAVIVSHAADGDFEGWGVSLRAYGVALASAVVLYPVRQIVVQMLLLRQRFALRGGGLDRLVAQEQDVGASAIEAAAYLAAAFLLTGLA